MNSMHDACLRIVRGFDTSTRLVLLLRFADRLTLREIAKLLSLPQSQVLRLHAAAMVEIEAAKFAQLSPRA